MPRETKRPALKFLASEVPNLGIIITMKLDTQVVVMRIRKQFLINETYSQANT